MDLFRSLAAMENVEICHMIAQQDIPFERRQLGWDQETSRSEDIIIGPNKILIEDIVATSSKKSIHIFSGIHWVDCIVRGLDAVLRHKRRFGILSEPRDWHGAAGAARFIHSWLAESRIRSEASFVLAIGRHGPRWFRMTGFSESRIFPFAYFLPAPRLDGIEERNPELPLTVSYLGRLERSKGIHLFLQSISSLSSRFKFEIAGIGSASADVQSLADGSSGRIIFHGSIGNSEVPKFLARTDILAVPSIVKDGWGAVVSEALFAGVAVIASNKVGSSICLEDASRGTVVHNLKPGALREAVLDMVNSERLGSDYRQIRSKWANVTLTGAAGAQYVQKIVHYVFCNGERPAPFYEKPNI